MEYPHEPGWMAKIATVIANEGGAIGAVDIVHIHRGRSLRDYTIECPSPDHVKRIVESLRGIEGLEIKSVSDDTFLIHLGGKLEIRPKVRMKTRADLSMAYTPGVARVCRAIEKSPVDSFNLTITLTREAPSDWNGETRRIDQSMIDAALNTLSDAPDRAYICGGTGFVEAMGNFLLDSGMGYNDIRTERFGP